MTTTVSGETPLFAQTGSSQFFIPRDVYLCRTDDGAIFMDLNSGKYFGLDLNQTDSLLPWIAGSPHRGDSFRHDADDGHAIASDLSQRGLLTQSNELGRLLHIPQLKHTSAVPFRGTLVPRPAIATHHVINFAYACMRTRFDLKLRPLACTVRRISARKAHERQDLIQDTSQLLLLVRVFRYLTPLCYTARGACLFDSLALVEFLAKYNTYPTWVIAVRTRPFEAHSWVQHNELVLNERLERVEEFVPIMTV